MALSEKQQKFVREYALDLNATAAYKRAGYVATGHSAESAASQLLRNIEVQQAIKAVLHKASEKAELSAAWVLDRLRENAARAAQAEPVLDRRGNPTGQYTYQGSVVNRAVELIGKHIGMFVDKVALTDPTGTKEASRGLVEEMASDLKAIKAWLPPETPGDDTVVEPPSQSSEEVTSS